MRSPQDRLQDVLEAIAALEPRREAGREQFDRDELLQAFIVRQMEIIGEAVRYLPQAWLDRHPEIPWTRIVELRNVLIHGYFAINLGVLWEIVTNDLDALKVAVQGIAALEDS